MVMDFVYPEPGCGKLDERPVIIGRIHYMYFALMLFLLTGFCVIVISYASKPPELHKVGVSTGIPPMWWNSNPNPTEFRQFFTIFHIQCNHPACVSASGGHF